MSTMSPRTPSDWNEGVTATVKQVPNAIGYVESAYAKQNKLAYALLQNKAGKYPQPDDKAFQAAAASADSCPLRVERAPTMELM